LPNRFEVEYCGLALLSLKEERQKFLHCVFAQVAATITRGLLKRTFTEWRQLCWERGWKNQCLLREREVGAECNRPLVNNAIELPAFFQVHTGFHIFA
jgi:hypothetical protein